MPRGSKRTVAVVEQGDKVSASKTKGKAGSKRHQPEAAKLDPLQLKYDVVSEVLASAEGFPVPVLQTLANNMRNCLSTPPEERHEFQRKLITMIDEVLSGSETSNEAKVAALNTKLGEADAEKNARNATLEDAVANEKACREQVAIAKAALAEAEAAKRAAHVAVDELGPELVKTEAEARQAEAEVTKCQEAIKVFKELDEGPSPEVAPEPAVEKATAELVQEAKAVTGETVVASNEAPIEAEIIAEAA